MHFSQAEQLKLKEILNDYKNICKLLTYQEVLMDAKLCLNYQKRKNILEPIALKYQEFLSTQKSVEELKTLKPSASEQEAEFIDEEISALNKKNISLKEQLKKLLVKYNAIFSKIVIEIFSNQKNSKLFIDLINGYSAFCKQNALNLELKQTKNGADLCVSGLNAKEFFINEVGLHETSNQQETCQVFILENIEVDEFNVDDVEFSTMRSSGAGGQHINTTDSAIRATHKKTGLVCVCQNERSQFQNKQKALENLKEKVDSFYKNQVEKSIKVQKQKQLKNCK